MTSHCSVTSQKPRVNGVGNLEKHSSPGLRHVSAADGALAADQHGINHAYASFGLSTNCGWIRASMYRCTPSQLMTVAPRNDTSSWAHSTSLRSGLPSIQQTTSIRHCLVVRDQAAKHGITLFEVVRKKCLSLMSLSDDACACMLHLTKNGLKCLYGCSMRQNEQWIRSAVGTREQPLRDPQMHHTGSKLARAL